MENLIKIGDLGGTTILGNPIIFRCKYAATTSRYFLIPHRSHVFLTFISGILGETPHLKGGNCSMSFNVVVLFSKLIWISRLAIAMVYMDWEQDVFATLVWFCCYCCFP